MSNDYKKPVVQVREVSLNVPHHNRAAVMGKELNGGELLLTSEVLEVRVITRNTEYVWKKGHKTEKQEEADAEDHISKYLHENGLEPAAI